jgi:LysR family transcriptional regulator, nitrogen assimilation regulatory protein
MDAKQLKFFVKIAEKRSLAAAAEALGITQPSLSIQVKSLETRLGTELLVRSTRGVVLTQAGEVLLRHAGLILQAIETAKQEVREAGERPSGRVVFGLPSSASMVLSVPLAETVRLTFPDIQLRAVDAMSGFIKEWLEEQSIDMALLYETVGLKNVEVTTLLYEDLHFYAPPDIWPLSTPPGADVPMAALQGLEFVAPSKSHGLRMMIDKACKEAGLALRYVVEMDSLSQIKSLVARGSAFTILAPAAAHDFEARGELVSSRIVDPVITRPVHLVRNPETPRSRAAAEVERLTLEVVADLLRRNIWRGHQGPLVAGAKAQVAAI